MAACVGEGERGDVAEDGRRGPRVKETVGERAGRYPCKLGFLDELLLICIFASQSG